LPVVLPVRLSSSIGMYREEGRGAREPEEEEFWV